MLRLEALRERHLGRLVWRTPFFAGAILATTLGLLLSNLTYGRAETETVNFNIPAQSLPSALSEFARQAHVSLVFSEPGFDTLTTNAVIGSYQRQRALQILLDGTGLRASSVSGDRVIVQRPMETSAAPTGSTAADKLTTLSAQATGDSAQSADRASENLADTQNKASPTTDINDETEDTRQLEEILVTGSRIRGAQNASPVVTITREDIDRAGFETVEQLVGSLPQNAGFSATQQTFNFRADSDIRQFNGTESSVNLRGLGSSATLVLLNGRRMAAGGRFGGFTNLSSIPLAAIERVEVLTDGASAIYGADAVAGVVNFVLQDNYEGAETRIQAAPDFGSDTASARFGQVLGKSWETGNILFSYEYYDQDNLDTADRKLAASCDLTSLGGDNLCIVGGNPGHIIAGGTTYAIPRGQDGTSLTAADFVGLEGTQNFNNNRLGQDLRGEQKRHSVFVKFRQALTEKVEYFLETRYAQNDVSTRSISSVMDLNVPDTNPFFVDPTGTGLTEIEIIDYTFTRDLGAPVIDGDTESYGGSTGVSFDFGASSWQGEISGSYATEEALRIRSNTHDAALVQAALAETDPNLAFNPFADGSNTNPAVLEAIRGDITGARVKTDFLSFNADFSGDILELPGGPVSLATGLEYREESIKDVSISSSTVSTPGIDTDREITAVYAELFVPLVKPKTGRPGMERLELSIAGRYSDYSDFGDNVSPKIGVVWSPSQSVTVRGTFGESFKPPLLFELDTTSIFNVDMHFTFTPLPAIFRFGGNADLAPEEATTWTAGIQLTPESVPGLNIDLSYFNIEFENRIIDLTTVGIFNIFDQEFAPLVNLSPTQEEAIAIASNATRWRNFGSSADDVINGVVPIEAIVDFRLQNFAKWEMTGLDVKVDYGLDTTAGRFGFGLNASYLFEIEQALLTTLPSIDQVNRIGQPVDLKARGSGSWTKGHWGIYGYLNYVDSYTDENSDPQRSIDSWTTVDLQVAYDTQEGRSSGWLDNIRLSLSVQNVFDEDPPFVNRESGSAGFALGYDPVNASVFGRAIILQVNKVW